MKDIYLHLTYIKKCSACLYFRSNEYTNTRKTVEIITYRKGGADRMERTEVDTRFL